MLRPVWQGVRHLIINGDAAELHDRRYRVTAANRMLELSDLCERDGVRLTILSGNHDALITDLRHLQLANGQIFVTHGDVFHSAIAPWSSGAPIMKAKMREALESLPPDQRLDLHARLRAAQHAAHAEWNQNEDHNGGIIEQCLQMVRSPMRVARLLHYWKNIPRYAERFAERHAPHSRFVIFGHTHRQGIWTTADRTLINTGGFSFPARPRAVVIQGDALRVHRIVKHGDTFVLEDRSIRTFRLHAVGEPIADERAWLTRPESNLGDRDASAA